ncbi:MAG: DUF1328 domain-containing protein [Chlamydiae bacterium]|nr:DUF1328 domain-containing protein [Chlamydiota bacterium]
MLTWAAIFLITGVVAGLYGFGGEPSFGIKVAKGCFFIFTTLFALSLIYSFLPEQKSTYKNQVVDVNELKIAGEGFEPPAFGL